MKKPSDNMVASSVSSTSEGRSTTSFTVPGKQTPVLTDTDSATAPTADEKENLDTEVHKSPLPKRKKKPVPGKGFSKSRQGCYNCKRRRVKCSEAKPECRSCNRMGLFCVYPEAPRPTLKRSHNTGSSSSKSGINLNHLQFYHHFLQEAYPPAPYGAGSVWRNVAAMSHEVGTSTRTSEKSAYTGLLTPWTVRVPCQRHTWPFCPAPHFVPRRRLLHPGTGSASRRHQWPQRSFVTTMSDDH